MLLQHSKSFNAVSSGSLRTINPFHCSPLNRRARAYFRRVSEIRSPWLTLIVESFAQIVAPEFEPMDGCLAHH